MMGSCRTGPTARGAGVRTPFFKPVWANWIALGPPVGRDHNLFADQREAHER